MKLPHPDPTGFFTYMHRVAEMNYGAPGSWRWTAPDADNVSTEWVTLRADDYDRIIDTLWALTPKPGIT